jgi:KaiC
VSGAGGKLLRWEPKGVYSVAEILGRSTAGGPRFKTGIATLDTRLAWPTKPLDIGIPLGRVFGIVGAPGAGKSMMLGQISATLAAQGPRVVMLVRDETREETTERVGQQRGFLKDELNAENPRVIKRLTEQTKDLDLQVIPDEDMDDGEPTIERAAEYLLSVHNKYGYFLSIDSLHRARCEAETARDEIRARITMRLDALRRLNRIERDRLSIIYTAEANRSAYASRDESKRTSPEAAAAESRDFEYATHTQLFLTSEKGSDIVRADIPKNKVGYTREPFSMRNNRVSASLTPLSDETVRNEKEGKASEALMAVEDRIREYLQKTPDKWIGGRTIIEAQPCLGASQREVKAALATGCADVDGKRKFHQKEAPRGGFVYRYADHTPPAPPPPPQRTLDLEGAAS